jgi:hypothetical protein
MHFKNGEGILCGQEGPATNKAKKVTCHECRASLITIHRQQKSADKVQEAVNEILKKRRDKFNARVRRTQERQKSQQEIRCRPLHNS